MPRSIMSPSTLSSTFVKVSATNRTDLTTNFPAVLYNINDLAIVYNGEQEFISSILTPWTASKYKYPQGLYIVKNDIDIDPTNNYWTFYQTQSINSLNTLVLDVVDNWTNFYNSNPTIKQYAYINYQGRIYLNLTGTISTNNPSIDTTNWDTTLQQDITNDTYEYTGFVDPLNTVVTYDGITRTVTVTGNVKALYKGEVIPLLVSGWTSPPHDSDDGSYFLSFTSKTGVSWSATPFNFKDCMVAMVFRDTANFCLRECHGLMDYQSHREFHDTLGTYLKSGGDMSDYVLNSTTVTDRRPSISTSLIYDEDCPTLLSALNNGDLYSRLQLVTTGQTNFVTDQVDIINLSGNRPYYNQYTDTEWVQTLFPVNTYGKLFLMAVPTTSDSECGKVRYLWVQPQQVSTSLETIRGITSSSLELGHIRTALAEYSFIGEVIIRYTANNWSLIEVNKLLGTKVIQASLPSGQGLVTITTDGTLQGEGNETLPLGLSDEVNAELTYSNGVREVTGNAIMGYEEYLNVNATTATITVSPFTTGQKKVITKLTGTGIVTVILDGVVFPDGINSFTLTELNEQATITRVTSEIWSVTRNIYV